MSKYTSRPMQVFLHLSRMWGIERLVEYTMKTTTTKTIKHRARLRSLHSICPFLCIYGLFIWRKSYFSLLFTLRTHTNCHAINTRLHWSETFVFFCWFFLSSFVLGNTLNICALHSPCRPSPPDLPSHIFAFNSKKKKIHRLHTVPTH